jgi:hypothetical protein
LEEKGTKQLVQNWSIAREREIMNNLNISRKGKVDRKVKFLKGRVLLAGAIAVAVALSGTNVLADNIANIETNASGTPVTLDSSPVITAIGSQGGGYTVNGHTFNNWAIFAQDSTGALELFGALPSGTTEPNPTVGDAVTAAGTFSPFHSIPEIGSIGTLTQVSTGNSLPTPPVFTIPQLTASLTIPQNQAGYVLQLQNVTLYTDSGATTPASGNFANANTAFYVKDSGGNIMELYFWVTSYSADAAMIGTAIPTGPVNITGFVSQSGTFPVEMTPLAFTAVPEPSTVALVGVGLMGMFFIRRRRA